MIILKTPNCCKAFMKLRAAYEDCEEDTWYVFQCVNCGIIESIRETDDDEDDDNEE